jgi:hypothetical protein
MGLESYITDPQNQKKNHIVTTDETDNLNYIDKNALVVATHPLKQYENDIKFFINSTYGIDMNIGVTTDVTENVNNGGDNVYWTASVVAGAAGEWDIDSTDQAHTGSRSIKYDNGEDNDTLQIAKGSNFVMTDYNSLIIWIYVDKDWKNGDSIGVYGWDTTTGIQVGTTALLEDYFSWGVFDVWQQITIPLEDMELSGETIDAIRIRIIDSEGKQPKMYLDDIQFIGTGEEPGSGTFVVEPELGTWLHCYDQTFVVAAPYKAVIAVTGDTQNATGMGLSYDDILGVSVEAGIAYQRVNDGIVTQSILLKQLSDILQFPHTLIENFIYDGTNTLLTIYTQYTEPLILKSENSDRLQYSINDDLSGFLLLRASVGCKVEQRQ